jgi:hypothetical protein
MTQCSDVCVILDDDIKLQCGVFVGGKKRFRRNDDELHRSFEDVIERCRQPQVGFCSFSQAFFNTSLERWRQNSDNAGTYFVNVCNAIRYNLDFRWYIDDRGLMLETIAEGLECWAHTYVAATKIGRHGIGGEASDSGRGAKHRECIRQLAARYPGVVVPVITQNASYIQNYGTNVSAKFYLSRLWDQVQKNRVS